MNTRILFAVFVLGALGACATTDKTAPAAPTAEAAAAPDAEILELGRELTRQFYEEEIDAVWSRMSSRMSEAMGSKDDLAAFRQQVGEQIGSETEVLEEQTTTSGPHKVYLRKASFSKVGVPILVQWALDPEGKISGFFVQPAQ